MWIACGRCGRCAHDLRAARCAWAVRCARLDEELVVRIVELAVEQPPSEHPKQRLTRALGQVGHVAGDRRVAVTAQPLDGDGHRAALEFGRAADELSERGETL